MNTVMGLAADLFAAAVAGTPDRRLARLMRSPLRRLVLWMIFWRMPRHLRTGRLGEVDVTVEWQIVDHRRGGHDVYRLHIVAGRGRVTRGASNVPATTTVRMDPVDFLKLVTGNADPVQQFFTGAVTVTGDLGLASRLSSLFQIPSATR